MSDLSTETHPPQDSDARPPREPSVAAPAPEDVQKPSKPGNALMFNVIVPLSLLAVGALVVLLLGSVQTKARPADDQTLAGRMRALTPVRVVRLDALDPEQTPLRLEVDGTVVPFRESRVAAEVSGRVVYKAAESEAGVYVRKDQLLMRIDDTDYKLDVERLTRQKEQEYQTIVEIDQEIANTQRLLVVAEKDVQLQQDEVDRQTKLPKGFSSQGEVDRAKRSLLQAEQQMVTYENQIGLLRKRRVRLEASERLVATQLKSAEVNLQRTEIRAPIDGVIVSEDADLNTFVARGSMLVTIEDTSKVEVATNLRMDQLYWILDQADQDQQRTASIGYELPETPAEIEYELTGRDGAVYKWNGRLLGYDGIGMDPATRTVPVRVLVDQPQVFSDEKGDTRGASGPSALVRGMYVRVHLFIKPKTPLVVIPGDALKPGNRVWQFIPDDSVLEIKQPDTTDKGAAEDESEVVASDDQSDEVSDEEDSEVADDEPKFDPRLWSAGRVVVRRSIVPIDSLEVQQPDPDHESTDQRIAQEKRYWVCEVRDQELTGGSFVVTSPLASVDNDNMPARADATVIGGDQDGPFDATQRVASFRRETAQ